MRVDGIILAGKVIGFLLKVIKEYLKKQASKKFKALAVRFEMFI